MQICWFIPTTGDGRYLGSAHQSRVTDYAYLRQIAQATDELGRSEEHTSELQSL